MTDKKIDVVEGFMITLIDPSHKSLWSQWSRLTGKESPISLARRSPIEQMIDRSSGYYSEIMIEVFEFYMEYIYLPLLVQKCYESK